MESSARDPVTAVVLKDLKAMTATERDNIRQVAERDEQLRKTHRDHLSQLMTEIQHLQRAREAEADFYVNKNVCALCMATLGRIFHSGAACPSCERIVCSKCRQHVRLPNKKWICTLCAKEWELRLTSGDWMERKDVMSRNSISFIILKAVLDLQRQFHNLLEPKGGGYVGKQSKNKQKDGEGSDSDISCATVDFNPTFPRRSLHLNAKPPPDSKNDIVSPHTAPIGLASKFFDQSFHLAASGLLHARSEAMLYFTRLERPTKQKPGVFSEGNSIDSSDPRDRAWMEGLARPKQDGAVVIKPPCFKYSPSNLVQDSSKPGITASTPHVYLSKSVDGVTATFLPPSATVSNLSLSSVASELEDHHVEAPGNSYGDVELKVAFNYTLGRLEVIVLRCRNLAMISKVSAKLPNPYVKVYLCGEKGGRIKRKAKTNAKTCNPVFNTLVEFPITKAEVANWHLRVAVCAKASGGLFRNQFLQGGFWKTVVLGETIIMITENLISMDHPMWFRLHGKR